MMTRRGCHNMAPRSLRILFVEDEFLLALNLAEKVQKLRCVAVGPAASLHAGSELVRSEHLDGALLNVTLQGENCYPLARECLHRKIPIAFVSGTLGRDLPADLKGVPRIEKPWTIRHLQRLMATVFRRATAA
jgi:DNA-binding response OmpR family regulator